METPPSERLTASKHLRTLVKVCWVLGAIAFIESILTAVLLAPHFAGRIHNGQSTASTAPNQTLPVVIQSESKPLVSPPVQDMTKGPQTEKPRGQNRPDSPVSALPLQFLDAKLEPEKGSSNKVLRVAIKSHSGDKIDASEVKVQVYFYDEDKNGEIVPSQAKVTSRWLSKDGSVVQGFRPEDWAEGRVPLLEIRYLSELVDPGLRFAGYVVAVYYKGELNDCRAEPAQLMEKFQPPSYSGQKEK